MEPTDEFLPTPIEQIYSDLNEITQSLSEIKLSIDEIYYKNNSEEITNHIKKIEKSIKNLSDRICGSDMDRNVESSRYILDEILRRADIENQERSLAEKYNTQRIDIIIEKLKQMRGSVGGGLFINNLLLLIISALIFYMAMK